MILVKCVVDCLGLNVVLIELLNLLSMIGLVVFILIVLVMVFFLNRIFWGLCRIFICCRLIRD